MKKLIYLFSIIAVTVAFGSCSKSDSDHLPKIANSRQTVQIRAYAGDQTQKELIFDLKDFAALEGLVKSVSSAEIQTNSYIEVTGVSGDVQLTDVTLTMASNSRNTLKIDDITGNMKLNGMSHLTFLNHIVDELGKRRSPKVYLSYKAAKDISTPISFTIYLEAKFEFK